MKYGATRVVMGEQEIARAMVSAVPDAPREPVLSSVEEADEIADSMADEDARDRDEVLPHVLRPEAEADEAGGNPPEPGRTGHHADEPGR